MTTKSILYAVAGVSVAGGTLGGGYYLLKPKASEETNAVIAPAGNIPPKPSEQDDRLTNPLPKQQKTIQQLFKDESIAPLNTGDGEEDKENWGKLVAKFLESSTAQTEKISADIKANKGSTDNTAANIKALKGACKLLLDKQEGSEDFEKNKQLATNWCTNGSEFLQPPRQ
ncbi:hypothetical protein A6V39_00300 [Candidatus Mycoplasma haematobovis]|uniref:Uncharacterized protein n=1 Tax=Candidatus Mycoplasma haematobovis TaxID=432608 RepID=A0A1A9QFL6_9MOLU|nr:hypothetical protein [Candidatus Mycoplasma haematobovis]OAL10490.1 hypothetical protein A6V39_00300 [Candidatus Mycoplasma haematobovis]